MRIISDPNVIDKNKWNSLINKSPYSSPFQTPEFYKLFNSENGLSADVFAIEENGEYTALVVVTLQEEQGIKRYLSRRGIIYGGPLVANNQSDKLSLLLENISNYFKSKLIYLESRNLFDYSPFKNSFKSNSFKYIPWLNYQVKTTELNKVKSSMSESRLRQIKKAQKQGVIWKEAKNINEISSFYDILSNLYRNKIKKPLFPKSLFLQLYDNKIGKYLLVEYKNNIIGGILCLIMPEKAIYEFYVCGLDNDYKKQYPSVMATWAAIEYANKNNIPVFDFMGAGSPDEQYGVREFKSRFGGELVEYGRFLCVLNPTLYKVGKIAQKVISKL